jgi:hypothetical protein
MARKKLTHRLPQLRVSEELYQRVAQAAITQELDISDVQRLALEDYTSPPPAGEVIPIVGVIKDGKIIFDTPPFKPVPGAKVLSRYLEIEPIGGK